MNKASFLMIVGAIAASVLLARWAPAASQAPAAAQAEVKQLMTKPLADLPGKEGMMITVTYPPGYVGGIHRHDAHAFVYVLEGSIVMQVKGGPELTLGPGDTYYENPTDIHVVGRNASATQPAKFVVTLLKNQGAPVTTPVR